MHIFVQKVFDMTPNLCAVTISQTAIHTYMHIRAKEPGRDFEVLRGNACLKIMYAQVGLGINNTSAKLKLLECKSF